MSVLDEDASGIRDGAVEVAVFGAFSIVGLVSFVFMPPIRNISMWHLPSALKSEAHPYRIVAAWCLLFASSSFLCFFATLFAAFSLQTQILDVQLYKLALYLIPLGVGSAVALVGLLVGGAVFVFLLNVMLVELWWMLTAPCLLFSCFASTLGLGLMVAIILEGCVFVVCPSPRREQITLFYSSVVSCFGVVFAPATAIVGLEYWYTHNGTTLIFLLAVLGSAALRPMVFGLLSKTMCCRKWAERVDYLKESLDPAGLEKPQVEDEMVKLVSRQESPKSVGRP